jgi:hypothetical protein
MKLLSAATDDAGFSFSQNTHSAIRRIFKKTLSFLRICVSASWYNVHYTRYSGSYAGLADLPLHRCHDYPGFVFFSLIVSLNFHVSQ